MGFKRIFVAIDRSQLAPIVFEKALELAQLESACLLVFYCLTQKDLGQVSNLIETETGQYISSYPIGTHRQLELKKELETIQDWLQAYCHSANHHGVPAEYKYELAEPGVTICDSASHWGADLIVIGRRGRKGLAEALLGSVSNYVLHHAPCSVLAIQDLHTHATQNDSPS